MCGVHTQAGDIFQETGDRHSEGQALTNLGLSLRDAERLQDTHQVWKRAVLAYLDSGDAQMAQRLRDYWTATHNTGDNRSGPAWGSLCRR
jgi:hypothetical protein